MYILEVHHMLVYCNDVSSIVRDFDRKVNNLLSEFSFTDSNTISVLFDAYCMSIHMEKSYDKNGGNSEYFSLPFTVLY